MKIHMTAVLFFTLLFFSSATCVAEMIVTRANVCTGISDREPIGTAETFSSALDRVYFFTEIIDTDENLPVKHVWYYKNKKLREIDLIVNGPRWRTWSYKNIYPYMKGSWRAELVDSENNILQSVSFSIK